MPARTIYALLVGIDEYPEPVPPLRGCVNDVDVVEQLLRARAEGRGATVDTRVLRNVEATRAAVVAGFREHLRRAGPDDVVLFYYSGHGSQEPAPPEFWAIEPDHLDETLVLVDSRSPGQFDLADKELATLIAEVAERDPHIVVVLDCCHSGSGTRADREDGTAIRRAPVETRSRPLDSFLLGPGALAGLDGGDDGRTGAGNRSGWYDAPDARHLLLSGCRSSETSKEVSYEGRQRGAMSVALERALDQAGDLLTYADLHRWVVADVRNRVSQQTPQLEAADPADLARAFLLGAIAPRGPYSTLSHDRGAGWVIDQGAVHGVVGPRGEQTTELAVFDHAVEDLEDLGSAVTTARVTEVEPERSRVTVAGDGLDRQKTYKTVPVATPLPPVTVTLGPDGAEAEALRAALAGGDGRSGSLLVAEAEGTDAELRVHTRAEGYRISRAAAVRPLVADITGTAAAERAVAALEHMARWMRLAELRNPSTRLPVQRLTVEVTPVVAEVEPPVPIGDRELGLRYRGDQPPQFTLALTNRTGRTLYCAILDLTEAYGVYNATMENAAVEVAHGQTLHALDGQPLTAYIPDELHAEGVTELTDILKVVVSTEQFDVGALLQSDLDVTHADRATRTAPARLSSTFDRLVNRLAVRHISAQPRQGEVGADWFVTDVAVSVTRPASGRRLSAGEGIELRPGLVVDPHPALNADVRLASAAEIARDVASPLPAVLRDDPDSLPFVLEATRGSVPDFDVLELVDPQNTRAVTPDAPLVVRIDQSIGDDEQLLAVTFDGEAFLPVGFGRRRDAGTEVLIERLPEPTASARSLVGSVSILFRKLVLRKVGVDFPYPLLRLVRVDGDALVVESDADRVKAAVAEAQSVLLYVHGIIGDTEGMALSSGSTSVVPPPPLIGSRHQALLTFDYENLDTPIASTAADLRDRLVEVGLGPGHGKRLVVVAHSMGGLATRYFIERLGGREVVSRLVTFGTPNGGSPWPGVQQWATAVLAFGLNRLGDAVWPARVLGTLVGLVERVDTALDEMTPGSTFLTELAASDDPGVRYDVVVGRRGLIPRHQDPQHRAFLQRLLRKVSPGQVADAVLERLFTGEDNDIAVSVSSARSLPTGRTPAPRIVEIPCDHMSYFSTSAGLSALAAVLDD